MIGLALFFRPGHKFLIRPVIIRIFSNTFGLRIRREAIDGILIFDDVLHRLRVQARVMDILKAVLRIVFHPCHDRKGYY